MAITVTPLLTFLIIILTTKAQNIVLENDENSTLTIKVVNDGKLALTVTHKGEIKLTGTIGTTLKLTDITQCPNLPNCLSFGSDTTLTATTTDYHGYQIVWNSRNGDIILTDCLDLNKEDTFWFGGSERWHQEYPIQNSVLSDYPYIVKEEDAAAIAERYWLNSLGVYVFVDDKVPLFVDENDVKDDAICYSARVEYPYSNRARVLLQYTIVVEDNPKIAHLNAVENFLGKPSGIPSKHMIARPIWSTWAKYKKGINANSVIDFAKSIVDNGFADGQLEIDDLWETCYGTLTFEKNKFPSPDETVKELKAMNFTVTLWTYPFVNDDCTETATEGKENGYFVKSEDDITMTIWWDGWPSNIVDMTNQEARDWYAGRLQKLREEYGIDAFKFDAGEGTFCPPYPVLNGDPEDNPNLFTAAYVKMAAEFDPLIEVRTGWRTQNNKHFVRMLDKDSRWGVDNGLYTLITTLITMNLNGYTIVLPDMIGGNGYKEAPDPELFIRWVQANTFMPAMQFSYLPWDFENSPYDVTAITKKFVELHEKYSDAIIEAINKSSTEGTPVNPPVWWVDPTSPASLACDTQFMLGEDIIVAPIIEQYAVSRDVLLPPGKWLDGNNGKVYDGNLIMKEYKAPIDVLPYFIRVKEELV